MRLRARLRRGLSLSISLAPSLELYFNFCTELADTSSLASGAITVTSTTRMHTVVWPVPCTLYPAPRTPYPVPCTLYPVPCTLYPVAPDPPLALVGGLHQLEHLALLFGGCDRIESMPELGQSIRKPTYTPMYLYAMCTISPSGSLHTPLCTSTLCV